MMNITDKDWHLFKEKLPCWQERHMARLNEEYIKILSGDGLASEKFWKWNSRSTTTKEAPVLSSRKSGATSVSVL